MKLKSQAILKEMPGFLCPNCKIARKISCIYFLTVVNCTGIYF